MEKTERTIAKAVSWQLLGLGVMALIGYAITGSVAQSGALAAVTSAVGFVSYVVHERVWARIGWGRGQRP
ncbi:MAG: DUF2061 domain-containing protein [Pseudomonadota bacterium]